MVAKLRALMNTTFEQNADTANLIEKLDLDIARYEKAANEQLSENTKKGIILGAFQNEPEMQKHIFRHPCCSPLL